MEMGQIQVEQQRDIPVSYTHLDVYKRQSELFQLAEQYGMKFITIKMLQDYRKKHEKLVEREAVVKLPYLVGILTTASLSTSFSCFLR